MIKLNDDLEFGAMKAVADALAPLDAEARSRVIVWASDRYATWVGARGGRTTDGNGDQMVAEAPFADFASLYDAADPGSESSRTLVAAYWHQVCESGDDFEAQPVNAALKDMGVSVSNITRALGDLEQKKPAMVRQIRKSGRQKQSRKRYRLTTAGIREVENMLGRSDGHSETEVGDE